MERHREDILFLKLTKNLILLLLIIYLSTTIHSESLQNIEIAENFYQEGDYKKSLTYWLKALQSNPNSTKAMLGYAKTSLQLNSTQDALTYYNKVLKIDPNNTEAQAGYGMVLLYQNKPNEAREYLEESLKKNPNDIYLLLSIAEVFIELGKTDLAIYKLEKARKFQPNEMNISEKLTNLYISQGKLLKAEQLIQEILENQPNSIPLERNLAILYAVQAYQEALSNPKAWNSYTSSKNLFETILVKKPKDAISRFWLAKLNVWKENGYSEDAKNIILNLLSEYPSNEVYLRFLADLYFLKGTLNPLEKKELENTLNNLLEKNDLDELLRFQAEEFCIHNLPLESIFRKKLGKYRYERYLAEKNSLYYESSLYHLYRARQLIPNHNDLANSLLEEFNRSKQIFSYLQIITNLRDNDPSNFKLQNKLEQAVLNAKKTLEYKEGFVSPTSFHSQETTSLPKIVLLDIQPELQFPNPILSPSILKLGILHALENTPGIHLANMDEWNQIKDFVQNQKNKSYNPYHKSIYFDLNETVGYPEEVRFIGFGTFKETNRSIQIHFQIYDRKTGKFFNPIKLFSEGRSSLARISSSIARRIKELIPKEGKILKIKKNGVIINLGYRNGLKNNDRIQFLEENKVLMEGKIIELGESISLVKPDNLSWERLLATGTRLIASKVNE